MSDDRLFRALLRFFPREFRDRYGEAMVEFHRDRLRAHQADCGSRWRFWIATITDLIGSAIAERLERPVKPISSGRRTDHLAHDLRIAIRGLLRTRAFTATVLATLALGIGANTAIFSVVNGVILRPLTFGGADRIVSFDHQDPYSSVSEPEFVDYRRDMKSLEQLAAYTFGASGSLTGGAGPERVEIARVSDRFFTVLRVAPRLGRTFSADEEKPSQVASPVVVISHGLWQRYYGGDAGIVGRSIELDGVNRTVIGVMPPRFDFPTEKVAIWTPLRLNYDSLWTRNNHYLVQVGRLANGATIEQARAEATVLTARWVHDFPAIYSPGKPLVPVITSIGDSIYGTTKPYLLALLGAAGFVLLIACVNVANLLLVRGESRRNELGIRTALGASGLRLANQLLTESTILALVGGGLGLLIGWGGTRALLALAPDSIPRKDLVGIDGRVLLFTLLVATGTGLLFGFLPARRAARSDSMDALRQSRRSGGGLGRKARTGLVIAEVALAVMTLAGAGLLVRSLRSLQSVDPGFDPTLTLTMKIDLPPLAYNDQKVLGFVEELETRVRAIPGVTNAGVMGWAPGAGGAGSWSIWLDGREVQAISEAPSATPEQVSPGYFRTLGIQLIAGRAFRDSDREDAPPVAIINQTMAREMWPGRDPLSGTLKMFGTKGPWVTVVGVIRDIRSSGAERKPPPTMFFPYSQAARSAYYIPRGFTLGVRTTSDPFAVATAVRLAVRELDRNAPVSQVQTMEVSMGSSLANRRFATLLLGGFAVLALILAGIGIYGIIAYTVSQRTSEIGLRMALGAEPLVVLKLVVVSEAARLIGLGLAIGVVGAIGIGQAIRSLLVGVSSVDPVTIGGVALTLTAVGLGAALGPARRATRVSPTEALRAG